MFFEGFTRADEPVPGGTTRPRHGGSGSPSLTARSRSADPRGASPGSAHAAIADALGRERRYRQVLRGPGDPARVLRW
jgi:hypothetical protein